MNRSTGVFEVDLFPKEVNSTNHPYATQLREILEDVAREHDCNLLSFEVQEGTVSFSFDNDLLTAKIIELLKDTCESES